METAYYAVVFVTTSSLEEARMIAGIILEKRKAACVSIVPAVSSRYWWEGKLDSAEESMLVVKTRYSAVEDIVQLVKDNHSYTVPEVIALPIIAGNEDYLRWMDMEVE